MLKVRSSKFYQYFHSSFEALRLFSTKDTNILRVSLVFRGSPSRLLRSLAGNKCRRPQLPFLKGKFAHEGMLDAVKSTIGEKDDHRALPVKFLPQRFQ